MSDQGLSPIEQGRLIEAVSTLTERINSFEGRLATFETKLVKLETAVSSGRAGLYGLMLGIGFGVANIWDWLKTVIGRV